jgi:hypothetical protein
LVDAGFGRAVGVPAAGAVVADAADAGGHVGPDGGGGEAAGEIVVGR